MFITPEDFKVVASEQAIKIISQADEANQANAIAEAQEEVAAYLRPKYDCKAIFQAQAEERNRQVVMYTVDIALYNMVAAMPQRMGSEIRKERYDRAIKWLEGVQAGKIVPDLPLAIDSTDTDTATSAAKLRYGNGPDHHSW